MGVNEKVLDQPKKEGAEVASVLGGLVQHVFLQDMLEEGLNQMLGVVVGVCPRAFGWQLGKAHRDGRKRNR